MRKLLNTLFVTTEEAYLTLDGENIVVKLKDNELGRFPLHALDGVFTFAYSGASPALMGACAKRGINLCFNTPNGRFLARTTGLENGNVLLRRKQYRIADDLKQSCAIAKHMILGKVYNCRWSIDRTMRDHSMRIDSDKLEKVCKNLNDYMQRIAKEEELETLRGLEGTSASEYFSVFDDMILGDKDNFFFHERNRRPPLDNVNALLSFFYSLLANDCSSALEAVGLDAYVGFMHRDRPGRTSLAMDMMEELRPCLADRMTLTLINNRIVSSSDFTKTESGAVLMTDGCRKKVIKAWQEHKRESIRHPYLGENIQWGLLPYVQSLLLVRYIRGDIDGYPPFMWK